MLLLAVVGGGIDEQNLCRAVSSTGRTLLTDRHQATGIYDRDHDVRFRESVVETRSPAPLGRLVRISSKTLSDKRTPFIA